MSFLNFNLSSLLSETSIALIFLIILSLLLYKNKDKLKIQKIVFPFLYMILYKAKWGIKSMDKIAKKYPKLVGFFGISGIYTGVIGMVLILGMLTVSFVKAFITPTGVSGVAIAQPFVKTSFGSPFFYIPFSYFIVAIFIIATVHEFAHGVVARLYNVKIKSSGFAFFSVLIPILPAAFVEPDNKQVKKLPVMKQMAIFAAGPMSNIVLAAILFLVMFGINTGLNDVTDTNVRILNYTVFEDNVTYPAEIAQIDLGGNLIMLDDTNISSLKDFTRFMKSTSAGQNITVVTNYTTYNVTLVAHPQGMDTGYLGLIATDVNEYKPEFKEKYAVIVPIMEWLFGLLIILFMFNLGVGLMNLAPLGGLDGGQMVLAFLRTKFDEKKSIAIWGRISLFTLFILLGNIFLPMIIKAITKLMTL